MILKAIIPSGQTEITVNGLHQWDYGQQLEIESPDLPAMVEVHFACVGMQTAEVRTCSAVSGKLTVAIPDLCLEQSAPIIAWVFAINGTEGTTVKTITLPIIPRTRPQISAGIPRDNTDAYTQFLTEVNSAVETLKAGDILVARAENAFNAENAVNAENAKKAENAVNAEKAKKAEDADTALTANSAGSFHAGSTSNRITIYSAGIYIVSVLSNSEGSGKDYTSVIVVPDLTQSAYSTVAYDVLVENSKKISNQIQYEPQGTNEAGEAYGFLTVYHDADYAYEYSIACAVRVTTLGAEAKG